MRLSFLPLLLFLGLGINAQDINIQNSNNLYTIQSESNGLNTIKRYNAVYGSIGFLSFNMFYERNFVEFDRSYLNYRFGYGWGGVEAIGNNIFANWQYIFGKGNSHLEMGVGLWYAIDDCCSGAWFTGLDHIYTSDLYPLINIGYRYEKPEGGFIFRLGGGSETIINISLGYSLQ